MELTAQKGKRRQGKKDQRPHLNAGPTLYRGVSATRATETGQDPSSPIALMYQSQVCRYPARQLKGSFPSQACELVQRARGRHTAHSTSLKAQVLSVAG